MIKRITSIILVLCVFITSMSGWALKISAEDAINKPSFYVLTGNKEVTVKWKKVENADCYYVYCYKGDKSVESNKTTKTSYKFENLTNGEEYKFLVRASDQGEKSSYTKSDWIKAKPTNEKILELDSPVLSISKGDTNYKINLKWNKVANATSYTVYYKKDGGKSFKKKETINGSNYVFDCQAGKYEFKIKANGKDYSNNSISSESNIKKATIKDPVLSANEFCDLMNILFSTDEMKNKFGSVVVTCYDNDSKLLPFDVWLHVDVITLPIEMYNYKYSISMTKAEKKAMLERNIILQCMIYKFAQKYMPKKKIMGGAYHGYYKYPNLKLDWVTTQAFTWVNYSGQKIASKYEDTKYTGKMKWYTDLDDYDFNLKSSDIEYGINGAEQIFIF